MASRAAQQAQIDELDDLLIELGRDSSPEAGLLLEHLAGVRTYLIDFMPTELALNLALAQKPLDTLPSNELKARIREFLKTVGSP